MKNAILTALVGYILIVLQFISAYQDNFLWPSQMVKQWGKYGLPLAAHAGVWGELLFITPILTWIVYNYSSHWELMDISISFAIGVVLTVIMVIVWVNLAEKGLPEAHAYYGKFIMAGWWHALFMLGAVTIFWLFFFYSGVTQKAATVVAVILGIHIFCGSHVPLGLIGPDWYPDRPHKSLVTWTVILVSWGALTWRCLTIK